jgi:nicotinate-nucleotide pyrophosphorylase (carboxylating)
MTYDKADLNRVIAAALAEDIGSGDITSRLLIPERTQARMQFVAREPMVVCGGFVPGAVYGALHADVRVETLLPEGHAVGAQSVIASATGPARALLTGERVALNLMQRLSGVATLTARYVQAVSGTKALILDTRKTMPGLRLLDKYAVRSGGGRNHRMRLDDMVLIKDNHIALCGGIAEAVAKARAGGVPVVVECDTLEQVAQALAAKPDRILLDNMDNAMLRRAVDMAAGAVPLEASGGVSLDTVAAIAATGVDCISVGRLTHSAVAIDIGADILLEI